MRNDTVGQDLATDFLFVRDQLTAQQLDYLERTRGFVEQDVLPVNWWLLGTGRVPLAAGEDDGRPGDRRRRHRGLRMP